MIRVIIYQPIFGGHFVLNDTLTDQHMLSVLAMNDPKGRILDSVEGNVAVAFCIFLGERLYECKQLVKVKQQVSFTTLFTRLYSNVAKICIDDTKPWDFELEEFAVFPNHQVSQVERAA
ncbi:hypothetical protein J8M21_20795 [Pseudoalteromonas luteoviolacea]|uniref:hypothetical protein n=1 Tax=Pseudoalteromonas luteoviolacea TaxID=43657 RepID=UPI001B3A48D3|nr:hypothetical protein [Pseudoalteromonas luteoviolacea]MBQ4879660.1 hypothetical protein [Pseudoalteromonas luteoviolacea]MBQ4908666.1 hypothetical protein [Pseudoalteromonas luteoviolacea]